MFNIKSTGSPSFARFTQCCRFAVADGNVPMLPTDKKKQQIPALSHHHPQLTLYNEVDMGDARLGIGLKAAGVRPLVCDLHLVNVD